MRPSNAARRSAQPAAHRLITAAAVALAALVAVPASAAGAAPPPAPSAPAPAAAAPAAPPFPAPTPADPRKQLASLVHGVTYVASSNCTGYTEDGLDRVGVLRYCFTLPHGFTPGKPRDMVIIIHGYGLDHTWGARVLGARGLADAPGGPSRPGEPQAAGRILISVDGTRETSVGTRFPGLEPGDIILLRDFVLEMTRTFPTGRIYIYGHSQGAFAALALANQFPRLFNGVVADSGGLPEMPIGGLRAVASVFIHAAGDPVIPYRLSVEGRDVLRQDGSTTTALLRTDAADHTPRAANVQQALLWCTGITTEKPDDALAAAAELLDPSPVGAAAPPPAFSLADSIARRFTATDQDPKAWPKPLKDVTDQHRAGASALRQRTEALALRHTAALRALVPDGKALRAATFAPDTPAPNWLGHLLALREQFRGVESVESYLAELSFDQVAQEHEQEAKAITAALDSAEFGGQDVEPAEAFAAVVRTLPRCFLYEPLPAHMESSVNDWASRAKALRLSEADLALLPIVAQYSRAVTTGRAAFAQINAAHWRPLQPAQPPAPAPAR